MSNEIVTDYTLGQTGSVTKLTVQVKFDPREVIAGLGLVGIGRGGPEKSALTPPECSRSKKSVR
jgi:hypothetical protein